MTKVQGISPRFDLLVFDFDGTLCDSNDAKTDAFYQLYLQDHGHDVAAAVRDHHLGNVGDSRFQKIRHVEREILGNDPDEQRVNRIAHAFSGLVEEAVVEAPLFDGVEEFLAADSGGTPYALASATPTDELQRITDRKGMSGFFDAIQGSPQPKAAILTDYISLFGADPLRVVMIGDQPSDADAARDAGTQALLITPPANWTTPFERVDGFKAAAAWLTNPSSDFG